MSFFSKKNLHKIISLKKENTKQQKETLKGCLETNTRIPHNLRENAKELLEDMVYNESEEETYSWPNISVTTSHDPSSFLKEFAKHFAFIFNCKYLSRSKMTNEYLYEYAHCNSITHLFILTECKVRVSSVLMSVFPYGKTYYFNATTKLFSKRMASLKENVYLVCDGFKTEKIGQPLLFDIRRMFPKIKEENKNKEGAAKKYKPKNKKDCRICAFINSGGTIVFKHYYVKNRKFQADLSMELNLFKISSGTFEMEGDVEYQINGYKNIINYDVI